MNIKQPRLRMLLSLPSLRWFFSLTALACLLILTLPQLTLTAQDATAEATTDAVETASDSPSEIAALANTFLDSLDETQRAAVLFDYNDEAQRNNWSNFPTGLYTRAGLAYGSLTEDQQTAVMALLQAVLSEQGYQKVINIMIGDEVLDQSGEGASVPGATFGFGQYFVSILGTPSETDPWILQWGGHHLALNITFSGANEILTPSHTGCQPCTYIANDQQVSVLGDEYTKAQALVSGLDADQQAQAVLNYSVTDLVLGPGEEERVLEPEGIPGSALTADQQAMLLDVISEWVNIANDSAASVRMAELEANMNETYFAWSGDTSAESTTSYFRVTGPTLLIEFSPQSLGCSTGGASGGPGGGTRPVGTPGAGGPGGGGNLPGGGGTTNPTSVNDFVLDLGIFSVIHDAGTMCHVHTIYRDPTNPYGSATTAQ